MTTTSPAPSVGARTSSIPRSRLAGRRTGCGLEDLAGHRSVDHERCDDAGATQAGDEGGGAPVPLRCRVDQALAPRTPALAADHGGRRTRLVEDDKGGGAHGALPDPPALASGGDVRSILLTGLERLFLCRRSRRRRVVQIVVSEPTAMPCSVRAVRTTRWRRSADKGAVIMASASPPYPT